MASPGRGSVDFADPTELLNATGTKRILLLGTRRAGKSSIQRVVFSKLSPHETLFLDGGTSLEIRPVSNNQFVRFQIWDFPGDHDWADPITFAGQTLSDEDIFGCTGVVVFVIDAQDKPYTEAVDLLHDIAERSFRVNPSLRFEVFVHKVDGDLFVSDEHKTDCQREIQQRITEEFADTKHLDRLQLTFYQTSIYDHSIFEAFSRVVQKLIPLPTLENLLNMFISKCDIEKAFLFDVFSKIFIATDSNPVDERGYELCSDMIDVVIDVSCIYGNDDHDSYAYAYDSASSSAIKLTGGPYDGRYLYLREVTNYLALVCIVTSASFERKGLIDHNIEVFKTALGEVLEVAQTNSKKAEAAAGSGAGSGAGAGTGRGGGAASSLRTATAGADGGAAGPISTDAGAVVIGSYASSYSGAAFRGSHGGVSLGSDPAGSLPTPDAQ